MTEVVGQKLLHLPVTDLVWERDLLFFDGPLLSLFRHKARNDRYLYYWCDTDGDVNRWMLLRVGETLLAKLTARLVPLEAVIPKGFQDDFVYLVDVDARFENRNVWMVARKDIPTEYTPSRRYCCRSRRPSPASPTRSFSNPA